MKKFIITLGIYLIFMVAITSFIFGGILIVSQFNGCPPDPYKSSLWTKGSSSEMNCGEKQNSICNLPLLSLGVCRNPDFKPGLVY